MSVYAPKISCFAMSNGDEVSLRNLRHLHHFEAVNNILTNGMQGLTRVPAHCQLSLGRLQGWTHGTGRPQCISLTQ